MPPKKQCNNGATSFFQKPTPNLVRSLSLPKCQFQTNIFNTFGLMFDWIPLPIYTSVYYQVLLAFVLFTLVQAYAYEIQSNFNLKTIKIAGILLFAFVLLYMGTRPISGKYFVDMATYNQIFLNYAKGNPITSNKDWLFHRFMWTSAQLMSNKAFFLMCTTIYVLPCYVIAKKWFKRYWYYAFLLLVASFSFWAYGTNGIRNGIATSFFLMALATDKREGQLIWLFLAVNFHSSMLLPTLGLVITWFYNQPKAFYYIWLTSIPLSLALPGFWESFFAGLVEDERSAYLTAGNVNNDKFSSTGFRWDFLLYSATGVFAGTYYLFKKKIEDPVYIRLFNVFLFANAFWILVIRANFSNRFAYLSWFLLALVICYPWLKFYFEKKQHRKLGWIILAYFGFTYFMNVVLKMN